MPGYLILDISPIKGMTESGIVLPEAQELKSNEAIVLSIGKPKPITAGTVDGKVEVTRLKEGNRVVYREYSGQAYVEGDTKLLICKEDDLLAVISK